MNEQLSERRADGSRPLWLVPRAGLDDWLQRLPPATRAWVRACGFDGATGKLLLVADGEGRLAGAAWGLGELANPEEASLWTFAGLADRLPEGDWHLATPLGAAAATRAATGWLLGGYRYSRYRQADERGRPRLALPEGADAAQARRIAAADRLARDLINTPASDLGPAELSAAAASLATEFGAQYSECVGEELLAKGLPAIHAVGRAAAQPPRLIDLRWGRADAPRVTLVGKGVCFDTGGLDLKPSQAMALMKKDMGGAAIALGLARLVMDAGLDVRLRLLVPAVENSVAGNSYRPGDVIATRKGLSVEIGNTDAEGRLILADALALADEEEPGLLIDLATLTGAARVALGPELPALYTGDESLARELQDAGRAEHDPVWRMPLWLGYDDDLSSRVADLNNIASHNFAGSVIAALFLRRFVVPGRPWLHLDLFAWNPKERPGRPVGAEAQCLRALFRLLDGRYRKDGQGTAG